MGRKKLDLASSEKHAHILKVASKLFILKGYNAVSMDAVADAAPVSKRTLYNHFKDKKALFSAVIQSRCGQLFSTLQDSLQDDSGPEKTLTHIGQQFLKIVLEPDAVNMYRAIITESQQFPELGKLFYDSGPKRTRAILSEYLQKLHKRGKLAVPQPELASSMFLGMLLNRIHMQALIGLKKNVSDKEKNEIIRYAVKLFIAGHR